MLESRFLFICYWRGNKFDRTPIYSSVRRSGIMTPFSTFFVDSFLRGCTDLSSFSAPTKHDVLRTSLSSVSIPCSVLYSESRQSFCAALHLHCTLQAAHQLDVFLPP